MHVLLALPVIDASSRSSWPQAVTESRMTAARIVVRPNFISSPSSMSFEHFSNATLCFFPIFGVYPTAVFKTAALNLSATLPEINLASLLNLVLLLVICDRFFDWDVFNPAVLVPNSIHRILSVGKVVGR